MIMEKKRLAQARYISGFNGLRTLAVVGVIFYHLQPELARGGFLGVPIFFVLSGYLITDLLRQELLEKRKIDIRAFYVRRMKRLYPAMIAMFLVTTTYMTLFQRNLLNNLRGEMISSLLYFNNWWQIAQGSSYFEQFGNPSPFTHIWSLSLEGQYYLIWPIVFILLIKFVKHQSKIFQIVAFFSLISAMAMAIIYSPSVDPTRVYYGTDTRIFSAMLGSALAFVWPSWKMKEDVPDDAKKVMNIAGVASVVLMILSFIFIQDTWAFVYRGGLFLFSVLAMIAIGVVAHPGASLNKWLSNPVFEYIGKRSYGIYLWQFPVMIFYEERLGTGADNRWLHTIIEFAIIIGVSELSYRFIEKPLRKYDYKKAIPMMKSWFQYPYLVPKKIKAYIGIILFSVTMVGLIIAPNSALTADQKQVQETIEENARKAKEHQQQMAQAQQENPQSIQPIDTSLQLDERYDLTEAQVKAAANLRITGFGDSVMLAAAPALQELFPQMYIDAEVGRQLYASFAELRNLVSQGRAEDTVLVSLGSNGLWNQAQFSEFMSILGTDRQVYWLSVHVPSKPWQDTVNTALKTAAEQYNNLHIIDWYAASNDQKDWFFADNVHPNAEGVPQYVKLIAHAILTDETVGKVETQMTHDRGH